MKYFDRMHMVSYNEIYGKEADADNLEALLLNIPSLSALEWLSYIYYRKTQLKVSQDEFGMIVMPMMSKMEDDTCDTLIRYFNKIDIGSYRFVDGTAILILMDKILMKNNKQMNKLSKVQASNLLKAYLICCDKKLPSIDELQPINNVEEAISVYLPEQLKINEIEFIKDYRIELIRFYEFMRFCERDDKYKRYVELFLFTRHCQSWNKYLFNLFYIYINTAIEATNKILYENQMCETFLETLCINDIEYTPSQDFNLIRKYPVLKTRENTFSILNMNFFLDKMFQGFLFDFASVLESKNLGNFSKIKSDIGESFTEHHLFYSAIKGCFHKQNEVLLSGKEIKKTIKEGEPDFYIRKGHRIFLFEFKDITIKAEVKKSRDFEKIKKELFEQLVYSHFNGNKVRKKPKAKGIAQIYGCINENLFDIISQCDKIENPRKLQVYPILVYQDCCFDIEGVNYLLNNEFKKMTNSMKNPHGFIIKDLIMIPLYLLYELEDYFSNGKIKLALSINEYVNQKSSGPRYEIRPFGKYLLEKAYKKGYHNEKTERFQKYIDTLKEEEKLSIK